MVAKLYMTDGRIGIYKTHYSIGGGDYGPVEYVSKCGLKWKTEPKPDETCDHIDCAIGVQKNAVVEFVLILFSLILGGFVFCMMTDRNILALAGCLIIIFIYILKYIFKDNEQLHELEEFKRNGTINQMRAYADPALDLLITTFDRAINQDPHSVLAWNSKGIGLKALNMQAIAAVDRAMGFDPKFADAWYLKGMALYAQNKYDEAIAAYDKATMSYDKAIMVSNKSKEMNEWHKDAWHKKGLALCMLGRYDEAISAYDQAIKINPNVADFLQSKGMALRMLGRIEEADKILKCARNEWNSKGMDLFNLERYFDAITAYDKALIIDPRFLCSWVNKGTALSKMGRYEEAIGAFNHAIEINPNNPQAWNRKGLALKKIGRKSEADDAIVLARRLGI